MSRLTALSSMSRRRARRETGARAVIGSLAQMIADDATAAANAAAAAGGRPVCGRERAGERIAAIEEGCASCASGGAIVNVLMWEIAKTSKDAAAEFDRTMDFVGKTITTLRELDAQTASWRNVGGVLARVRRAAIGIMMLLGPYNYLVGTPIPALLMGNCVVMKLPAVGGPRTCSRWKPCQGAASGRQLHLGLGARRWRRHAHRPRRRARAHRRLEDGGRGDARARAAPAGDLPAARRENVGIVTAGALLDVAVAQTVVGSTSYNGQRCAAIVCTVHESVAEAFVEQFVPVVAALRAGPPDTASRSRRCLPAKPGYLQELVADAVAQGARVLGGGTIAGALVAPTVVYPVRRGMRLWDEEQFGPVILIGTTATTPSSPSTSAARRLGSRRSSSATPPRRAARRPALGDRRPHQQHAVRPKPESSSARRSSALGTMSVSGRSAPSTETLVAASGRAQRRGDRRARRALQVHAAARGGRGEGGETEKSIRENIRNLAEISAKQKPNRKAEKLLAKLCCSGRRCYPPAHTCSTHNDRHLASLRSRGSRRTRCSACLPAALADRIYTSVNAMLIAVNPCMLIDKLYGVEQMQKYSGEDGPTLPPHVYRLAAAVHRGVVRGRSQSVVISGESGAGKTETFKRVIQYISFATSAMGGGSGLALPTGAAPQNMKAVEQLLVETVPVLESFGNASTVHNPTSSRFGKFVVLHFDASAQGGALHSVSVRTYLLEKTRVVRPGANERGFHIFYELLRGGDDALLQECGLAPLPTTRYLPASSFEVPGRRRGGAEDDAVEFAALRAALTAARWRRPTCEVYKPSACALRRRRVPPRRARRRWWRRGRRARRDRVGAPRRRQRVAARGAVHEQMKAGAEWIAGSPRWRAGWSTG